ncbi:type II toxin-antitoxin system HicA family toxin [Candidatus Peregrinibacteria bacterium]|nr:type II toxin-antitoxin system HicA family toxin [Candidatus Peregrinibacteria bacterium]
MGKLPRVSGKDMIRFLERQGFVLRRVRGSHHILVKGSLHVPVPVHGNEDLRTGTLRSILRLARMEPEEFERLWRG